MAEKQGSQAFVRIGIPMFILVTGGSLLCLVIALQEAQGRATDLGLQGQSDKSRASLEKELQV